MYISFLNTALLEASDEDYVVHSFYADSFSTLYDVPKEKIINSKKIPTENTDFLLSVIGKTMKKSNNKPNYFFDIRTTEEFGRTAPEYALLHELNLNTTVPLSIKGMGSLSIILGFQLASLYIENKKTALFCVSELYHKYDEVSAEKKNKKAVSFFLTSDKGKIKLKDFGFIKTAEETENLLRDEHFDAVFIENTELTNANNIQVIPVNSGLVSPFMHEIISSPAFRLMTILRYKDNYGFYIIEKGEMVK